jgi:8-oxo-dGTP pyrophosphatase MutT (NUDIX family)
MTFSGSYLWRLRQRIGRDLVLMPGAMIVVESGSGILMTERYDDGRWSLPAGAAEEGGSFALTALTELREETGLSASEEDLIPFGCLSEAEMHTIHYPNGDVTHCFAMCFKLKKWTGELVADHDETRRVGFFDPRRLPAPVHEPTRIAIDLYLRFSETGRFQVR